MMKILKNKHHILLCGLAFLFVLAGCKVKRPKEIIPEDQMELLLYDYHIAKALGENLPYNENYKKVLYVEYVFQKHGTTEAAFDSSMVWYTRHAEILSKIYERINKKLKAEQTELDQLIALRDNKPKISTPGDSIDVWLLDRMIHLTGEALNNRLTFSIPSDSNFKARDTLQWDVYYHFLNAQPDTAEAAFMSMAIQYANDSVISDIKRVFAPGLQRIRLQADTLGEIKEIRGFIYYTGGKDSVKHLFANQISLMRYHSNDSLFTEKADSIISKDSVPEIKTEKLEKPEDQTEQSIQQERITPDELRIRRGERPRPARRNPDSLKVEEISR